MLSAMARTTVGPAPVKRPPTPSSFTILHHVRRICPSVDFDKHDV